jgi:hypothetical protein
MTNGISAAPSRTFKPTDAEPLTERRNVGLQTIGSSFSVAALTVHSPLIAPHYKCLGTLAAGLAWTGIRNITTQQFVPTQPRTLGQSVACNTATFFPFIPAFALQVYLNHPATRIGQTLAKCTIGRYTYPVCAAATRLLAQLLSTLAGTYASAQVDEALGVEMKESGQTGKIDWKKIPSSLIENPGRSLFNLGLFGAAALSFHPRIKGLLMERLTGTPQLKASKAELIATTGLVAAAVVSNVVRQSSPGSDTSSSFPVRPNSDFHSPIR